MAGDGVTCGQLLRRYRQAAGLTQEALAERSGYSANYLSKLERDQRQPPRVALERLADILGLEERDREALRDAREQHQPAPEPLPPAPMPMSPGLAPPPLPLPPTSLLGREAELAALARLLGRPAVRLVTIVGPPGVGKTRLALEVAAHRRGDYAAGVCFVDLAPVQDAALVVPAIAQALGVRERRGRPLLDDLVAALHDQHLLLVLDNCEQVLAAAPALAHLQARCPQLVVLATSRAPLRLRGEHECPLAPLAVPDLAHLPNVPAPSAPAVVAATAALAPPAAARALDPAALAQYPAVALFVERASAVRYDFAFTAENARAVAELCVRLDGLPLAIELAAARLRLLPLPALAERLTRRLSLLAALSGGPRDAPARQQTLRATVDWSYHLLDAAGQRLFQRLGVFAGGFTLDAAEAVCGDFGVGEQLDEATASPIPPSHSTIHTPHSKMDVLDGFERLADASLLTRVEPPAAEPAGEVRFGLLETLREYALERLEASGKGEAVRCRHAAHFAALAEAAAQGLRGPGQVGWLGRLEQAHDNLREALRWAAASDDPAAPALGLRLVAALWRFWLVRGHVGEGRRWVEAAIERGAGAPAPLRARALAAAGALAHAQGDDPAARRHYRASVALWREVDPAGEAAARRSLGSVAGDQADDDTGRDFYEASLANRRMLGDRASVAQLLRDLGSAAYGRRDFVAARSRFEQSLGILRELGDDLGVAEALLLLGHTVRAMADPAQAQTCCAESLALFRAAGSTWGEAVSLAMLGEAAHDTGQPQEGAALLAQSVALLRELSDEPTLAYELFRLAEVVLDLGDTAAAAALCREGLGRMGAAGSDRRLAAGLEAAGGVALARSDPAQAVVLLGAAGHLRETLGAPLVPADRLRNDRRGEAARAALGDDAFAAALEIGRLLPLPRVIEQALADLADTPCRPH